MEQLLEYVTQGKTQKICQLKKVSYRFKQSFRVWFEIFNQATRQWDLSNVIPMVYVDDILMTSNDFVGVEETKQHLNKCFVIKDLD